MVQCEDVDPGIGGFDIDEIACPIHVGLTGQQPQISYQNMIDSRRLSDNSRFLQTSQFQTVFSPCWKSPDGGGKPPRSGYAGVLPFPMSQRLPGFQNPSLNASVFPTNP